MIEVDGVAMHISPRSKRIVRDARYDGISGRQRKLLDNRTV
jgi:IS5 family transposase